MHTRVCCYQTRQKPTQFQKVASARFVHHPLTLTKQKSQRVALSSAKFMNSCLAVVSPHSKCDEIQALLQQAQTCKYNRVYVTTPSGADAPVTQQLLDWLCELYNAAAAVQPRFDAVPCLACAGWTAEKLATLSDVRLVLAPAGLQQHAQQLQQLLNTSGTADQEVRLQLIDTAAAAAEPGRQESQQQQQGQQQLLFDNVAVGGTFDRLHAGHRLLLAATALVCRKQVYVGITADNLLAKKTNKQLLHDYEARRAAAVDFMVLVRPALAVQAGALTDPQEPTQAELDPSMQALVVSQETLPGGEAINIGRQQRGFAQLQLVVVGLIGGDAASKLSSTALREADAAAAAAQAADAAARGAL